MGSGTDGFARYLVAKRSVDDRALNRQVVDRLRGELAKPRPRRLRAVEIGAGLGTMLARLVDWQLLTRAEYLLLDVDAGLLEAAQAWLRGWAEARQLEVADVHADVGAGAGLRLRARPGSGGAGDPLDLVVRFVVAELGDFLGRRGAASPCDLLIANAVLDLVDVPRLLPKLLALLGPEGLFWFTINFDGETIFEPGHSDDRALLAVYHRSMDERFRDGQRAGDSRSGRHLFGHLTAAGATLLAAGASDWVVYPRAAGYPEDEATFLRAILDTIGDELRRHEESAGARLENWLALRRRQVQDAELVYIAHQLDFLGRAGP